MVENPEDHTDWSLATWEGARREALRRWAKLPLERIVAALEEMEALSGSLSDDVVAGISTPVRDAGPLPASPADKDEK